MKNFIVKAVLSFVLFLNLIGIVYYRVVPSPPPEAHKVLIAPHGTPLIVVIWGWLLGGGTPPPVPDPVN